MRFSNRSEAGKLLAEKLKNYKGKDVVVYALPRGGVVVADEIASYFNSPLDLIITRKISHPSNLEYAIAAVAENGHIVGNPDELAQVDRVWLEKEIEKGRIEVERRRKEYLSERKLISPEGKVAILVDDGVATGLTLRVSIIELKHRNPQKLIVAVPVIPWDVVETIEKEVDEVVALDIPPAGSFSGAVGSYYNNFTQITDEEVRQILKKNLVQ